jgi:hypothetical protein
MYAPANNTSRRRFFPSLSSLPIDFSSLDFFVGDWNDVPHMQRDRFSHAVRPPPTHWPLLQPLLRSHFDAALAGAAAPYFTFQHSSHFFFGRLDHVFASTRFSSFLLATSVQPLSFTDHSLVSVSFSPRISHLLYYDV